jgi:hypothetical protein
MCHSSSSSGENIPGADRTSILWLASGFALIDGRLEQVREPSRNLDEVQQRHVRERMTKEEPVTFGILT